MNDMSYINWVSMSDKALNETIGAFVKYHRLNQNKTQDEVSEAAGISRSTLSLLERGEKVSLSTVIQVLRVLDLQLSALLGLAGNEVRLKILYLLYEENELCVCDLSDILNMNVSAISQHLRKLKDGNVVDVRKEGQTYFYFVKNNYLVILESFFNIINSKSKILKLEVS